MSLIVLSEVTITNKIGSEFIDSIISEMHFIVFEVTLIRLRVLRCCQSTQSILVDKHFERVKAADEDIHS